MTTTTERVDGAAQHLVAARHAGSPGPLLPDALRPEDVDTALAIQQRVADLLGEPVG
ncbi:2-keto-4-pentenoate hydratase, partial [Bacteroides thetaiotaomicron]|nr:2-keto-4-pentenoate hydratase [Bacteroides thetaiotaomicron]